VDYNVKLKNPTILRENASIGKLSAEQDDDFLADAFIYHPMFSTLTDKNSPTMILLGRTGSGKTALLRRIEMKNDRVKTIDLVDLMMDHVSNSDVIRFLSALGIDLDLFFQTLWKHLLCLEFIRLRFKVENEQDSGTFVERVFQKFLGDGKRKRAIEYLKKWEGKFWITADENIKEITRQLETKVSADLGVEVDKFRTRAGYERTLSAEKKSEVIGRAKKFVNSEQIADLSSVMDMLGELNSDSGYRCFLLIDRIDEKWVDESLRFKLVRALIESLRSFRKIDNLRIIVALRTDVYERVIVESDDVGFQREKYEDYTAKLEWDAKQLHDLVDSRIRSLYRRKYTKQDVDFGDLFSLKVGGVEPLTYILERTLFRPRDMVSFVNECLLQAVGQSDIAPKHIKAAEAEFSRKRLEALYDEWRSTYPSLETVIKLLRRDKEIFAVEDLFRRDSFQETVLAVGTRDDWKIDPLFSVCRAYVEDNATRNLNEVGFAIVEKMYRIGVFGVKLHPDRRYEFSHLDNPILPSGQLTVDTKVRIHPMLHRALGIGAQV